MSSKLLSIYPIVKWIVYPMLKFMLICLKGIITICTCPSIPLITLSAWSGNRGNKLIRKAGKLPPNNLVTIEYGLEYKTTFF